MAYADNELFNSASVTGRLRWTAEEDGIMPKTFAADALAPTIAPLTPVGFDTVLGAWIVWDNANGNGANAIKGFTIEEFDLDAADEVLANVLLKGVVHYGDIVLPSGQTTNNLKAALRSGPRSLGLTIEGLDEVR